MKAIVKMAVFATLMMSFGDAMAQTCPYANKAVSIYGQSVCPDRFNADDQFLRWDEMVEHLPEFMPGAFEKEKKAKTAPELCEHVKVLLSSYGAKAESLMGFVGASLSLKAQNNKEVKDYLEIFRENQIAPENISDTAVVDTMIRGDAQMMDRLLSYFDEDAQIKILIVNDMVDKAAYLTLLHDSVLDTCSSYAEEKQYYKIMNYNGPDANYNPANDPGWDALRKKWDEERAAQGKPPLSSIPNGLAED